MDCSLTDSVGEALHQTKKVWTAQPMPSAMVLQRIFAKIPNHQTIELIVNGVSNNQNLYIVIEHVG